MDEKIIDGLKRRFQDIEKFKYTHNFNESIREYLSFVTHNPTTLNTTRIIIANKKFPDEFLLAIIFLLARDGDYSLMPSKLPKNMLLPLFKKINSLYEKKIKGKTPKIIEKERQKEILQSMETIISESTKESFLLNLSILNNKLIDDLNKNKNQEEIETNSLWITKNNKGGYCFDGNIINISKDTDYAKIFDAVLSISPTGGDVEYNQIKKVCKTKKLNTTNKSVQKALTGKDANLFRFTKGIKQFTNYGTQLFKASSSGKYITFNNKK